MNPNSSYLRGLSRRVLLSALAVAPAVIGPLSSTAASAQAADPLPSWNEGSTKQSILAFVSRVTTQGGPDFVPADQRIATFDNDGTLWCEQPMYVQLAFILDRVKALAPMHPEWREQQPVKAVFDGDMKAVAAAGGDGGMGFVMGSHAGRRTEGFERIVKERPA